MNRTLLALSAAILIFAVGCEPADRSQTAPEQDGRPAPAAQPETSPAAEPEPATPAAPPARETSASSDAETAEAPTETGPEQRCAVAELQLGQANQFAGYRELGGAREMFEADFALPTMIVERNGRYVRILTGADEAVWVNMFDVNAYDPADCIRLLEERQIICAESVLGTRGSSACQRPN